MKKTFFLYISFFLISCSDKNTKQGYKDYPLIDIINSVEKYQRAYCSDYFSTIELIALETNEKCLLDIEPDPRIVLNDSLILMRGSNDSQLYAFDQKGEFKYEIGRKGQGPGEYLKIGEVFFSTNKQTIYVVDFEKFLEYDFKGKYIRSFQKPTPDDNSLYYFSNIGDNHFIGQVTYNGKNKYKYCLINQDGDTVKTFPNHIFFDKVGTGVSTFDGALCPIHVDNQLYLKDYINDTIYSITNFNMQPAYIFNFGEYSFSGLLDNSSPQTTRTGDSFILRQLIGFPNYFFYHIRVPELFNSPETKPKFIRLISHSQLIYEGYIPIGGVYGIYNIKEKNNILLDTDQYFQMGIINDINGGLPFVPRYYAGNGVVVDVWNVEYMKEMLTDEYFASQTIKDQQSYQKLKELLKIMKDDDNPVVVIAKLK